MPSPNVSRADIEARQIERVAALIEDVWRRNRFWQTKWRAAGIEPFAIYSMDDFLRLPLTTKAELIADQEREPPFGTNLTEVRSEYVRFHQTSGTKGRPLRWLDTAQSWDWLCGCWRQIFAAAGIGRGERAFFPFSFGPFLGFWSAFDAAASIGCLAIPAGGLSTGARLTLLLESQATALCCTPTYALHLAQAARESGIDLNARSQVRTIVVAGEPGGSIPATRSRIEETWNARVIDHTGLTEVGPLATEFRDRPGFLEVLENDFIAEIRDPATMEPTKPGEVGELIVTNLGRGGSPLIRYRTSDLVRPIWPASGFLRLQGGVLGRVDDMIPIRGNNFYPTSLEAVLRKFPEIVEYQVEVDTTSPLAELRISVEPTPGTGSELSKRVAAAVRDELFFRAEVALVAAGSLPRFEMKATRVRKI